MEDAASDIAEAVRRVGPDAKPTGRLRFLQSGSFGRLYAEWRGCFGSTWVEVPTVHVDILPERAGPDMLG